MRKSLSNEISSKTSIEKTTDKCIDRVYLDIYNLNRLYHKQDIQLLHFNFTLSFGHYC